MTDAIAAFNGADMDIITGISSMLGFDTLHVERIILCAVAGRTGRDPQAAEWHLPVGMDGQR